jgi:NADPH:quinone reductase-like Zn-dependent oxidoreductase
MEGYHIDRFGSVDGIVLRSSEDPRPGLREVLTQVRASLLNYRDLRAGLWAERSAISAKGDRGLSDSAM